MVTGGLAASLGPEQARTRRVRIRRASATDTMVARAVTLVATLSHPRRGHAREECELTPQVLTERELTGRLRRRFEGQQMHAGRPEHILVSQVQVPRTDDSGRERRLDAVAIGVWRRTGHLVHGFEIKTQRADWLYERRYPAKSADGRRVCHTWSVVVPNLLIAQPTEMPPGWGLYVAHGIGLRLVVAPAVNPQPECDYAFMAWMVAAAVNGRAV